MKSRHAFIFSLIFIPLCCALRILQYTLVIDKSGYFRPQGAMHTALIYALYAAFALAALYALVLLFAGKREFAGINIFKSNVCGVLFCAAGILMMTDAGIGAGGMIRARTVNPALIAEAAAAIYFVILGYRIMSGSRMTRGHRALGLLVPVYLIAYAISEFFGSFEKVHVSQTKLSMLSICSLSLFLITVILMFAGTAVKARRLTAVSMLYAVIAAPCAIADIYAVAAGEMTASSPAQLIIRALTQLIFAALALTALKNGDIVTETPADAEDDSPDENFTDIKVDDIIAENKNEV